MKLEDARAYIRDGFQTIATTIDNVRHNIVYQTLIPNDITTTATRLMNHCANMLGLNINVNEAGELYNSFVNSLVSGTLTNPFGIIDMTTKGGYILAALLSKGMNAIIEN